VRFEDPEWTELDTVGPTLALHRSPEPPVRSAAAPDVTFRVEDVRAAHRTLRARGVAIAELKKVHDAGPMVGVAAQFHDPEGNRLSIYGLVAAASWQG
jgi:predicted enzyme related to lactoylglutathione lyase